MAFAFGPSWLYGLIEIFNKASLLSEKMRTVDETYSFSWYHPGQPLSSTTMNERYPPPDHNIVDLALFPCVRLHGEGQAAALTISKAQVIGGTLF